MSCSKEEILEGHKNPLKLPETLCNADTQASEILDDLIQNYAVAVVGNKTTILRETKSPEGRVEDLQLLEKGALFDLFENQRIEIIDPTGKTKLVNAAKHWIKLPHRRTYFKVAFSPSRTESPDAYNLFQGFPISPVEGDCSLYQKLVREQICANDNVLYTYLLHYMADAIQNPENKPGICIVLRGAQGAGKGTLAKCFGKLFGEHFVHVTQRAHFLGNFNSHLATALILFVDEAIWPGDKAAEGVLKARITEETQILEKKGKDAIQIPNYCRILMATNEEWAVPAGIDDRRFVVIDIPAKPEEPNYFTDLYQQMENGGYEALMHFLMNRDLTGVNLRKRPKTNALLDQKLQSLDPFMLFWLDLLQDAEHKVWRGEIDTEKLIEQYHNHCQHLKTRSLAKAEFGKRLNKVAPGLKKVRRTDQYRDRYHAYAVPNLDTCRKHFLGRPSHQA